jgi:hypothetical protein
VLLRPLYAAIFRKMPGHGQDRTRGLEHSCSLESEKKSQNLANQDFWGPVARPRALFPKIPNFSRPVRSNFFWAKTRKIHFFQKIDFSALFFGPVPEIPKFWEKSYFFVFSGKIVLFPKNRVFQPIFDPSNPESRPQLDPRILTSDPEIWTLRRQNPDPQTPES